LADPKSALAAEALQPTSADAEFGPDRSTSQKTSEMTLAIG